MSDCKLNFPCVPFQKQAFTGHRGRLHHNINMYCNELETESYIIFSILSFLIHRCLINTIMIVHQPSEKQKHRKKHFQPAISFRMGIYMYYIVCVCLLLVHHSHVLHMTGDTTHLITLNR